MAGPRKVNDIMADHSREDVWNELGKQREALAILAEGQTFADRRMDALEKKLDDGLAQINESITRMSQELHRPTNLVGWLSAMGSLCVILAGFVLLVNEPLQIAIARNHDDIVRTEESADTSSERIARNEGRLEVLEEVVKDIDKYGSRRWNAKQREE